MQARATPGAVSRHRSDQGVGFPGREIKTQARQQLAGFSHRAPVVGGAYRHSTLRAVMSHAQVQRRLFGELTHQRDLQFLGVAHPAVSHLHDFVTARETRHRRRAIRAHLPDHRLDDFGAHHRQHRIHHGSEDEIHRGPRQQDCDAMQNRPSGKGPRQLRRVNVALPLVEQLDVATKGNGSDAVLGLVRVFADTR